MDYIDMVFAKAKVLIELDRELREAEDDYLETWLMEGVPDGSTLGDFVEFCTENTYYYFVDLACKLIAERGIEEL